MKNTDKQAIVSTILYAFVEGQGFREQDFLRGLHDFIPSEKDPDQTVYQKEARKAIMLAIKHLNDDDKRG